MPRTYDRGQHGRDDQPLYGSQWPSGHGGSANYRTRRNESEDDRGARARVEEPEHYPARRRGEHSSLVHDREDSGRFSGEISRSWRRGDEDDRGSMSGGDDERRWYSRGASRDEGEPYGRYEPRHGGDRALYERSESGRMLSDDDRRSIRDEEQRGWLSRGGRRDEGPTYWRGRYERGPDRWRESGAYVQPRNEYGRLLSNEDERGMRGHGYDDDRGWYFRSRGEDIYEGRGREIQDRDDERRFGTYDRDDRDDRGYRGRDDESRREIRIEWRGNDSQRRGIDER
jgi:hypothetical protein